MGKRNKKNQSEGAPEAEGEQDMVQCPTCESIVMSGLPECPQCGQEFIVDDSAPEPVEEEPVAAEPEAEPVEEDIPELPHEPHVAGARLVEPEPAQEILEDEVEEAEEPEPDDEALAAPEIKKGMLILGLTFSSLGSFGIVGLRAGLVQTILGYTPSPGIGPQESLGLVVSMIPLVLGLVIVLFWGIKNNPAYLEIEKARDIEAAEDEDEGEKEEPEVAVAGEFEDTLADLEKDLEDDGMIEDVLGDTLAELEAISEAPVAPEPEEPLPVSEPGAITGADMKTIIAEELRAERCEKMLRAVVVLPDDKTRLKSLIGKGISPNDFAEEIRKAVERRMKKEQERDVTADEKAAILEDELVADLAALEDELDNGKSAKDSEDLEDEILREIEDLEGL